MLKDRLGFFVSHYSEKALSVREYYLRDLRSKITSPKEESSLPFSSRRMYDCWINFSPFYYRELHTVFSALLAKGYQPEDLAPFIENKARVVRYVFYLLLPGAFLDRETALADKLDFLVKFECAVTKVLVSRGYPEPDSDFLFGSMPLSRSKAVAISQLIAVLGEACELLYYGDQTVGFYQFGLDRKIIPEHYTVYQNFDLNGGIRQHPIGKIQTITMYPQHERTAPPFTMIEDYYSGNLFMHGYWDDTKWRIGRPGNSVLVGANVGIGSRSLAVDEIERTTRAVIEIIREVAQSRQSMTREEQDVEYCVTKSGAIVNLNRLEGHEWRLSKAAADAVGSREWTDRLKREWGLQYSFEVAYELIRRSIGWVCDECLPREMNHLTRRG